MESTGKLLQAVAAYWLLALPAVALPAEGWYASKTVVPQWKE